MAVRIDQNFLTNFALFLFLYTAIFVQGEDCPQQSSTSPSFSDSTNKKARNLAGSGKFIFKDSKGEYEYQINLCKPSSALTDIAIVQNEIIHPLRRTVPIGYYKDAHVFGGSNWLMIQYTGQKYNNSCSKAPRRAIIYIGCDQSADTHAERTPRILEEYKPDSTEDGFCYYLFEMRHDGVCPPEKTKISPGSVFIIILVIVGVLYLVLGLLYQRFIVGAKGMEQIPNYLMWREFGTLQADGCNYMCRCKGTREPTRYKPMDDAIADDEDFSADNGDNDDAMLPM